MAEETRKATPGRNNMRSDSTLRAELRGRMQGEA